MYPVAVLFLPRGDPALDVSSQGSQLLSDFYKITLISVNTGVPGGVLIVLPASKGLDDIVGHGECARGQAAAAHCGALLVI